MTEIREAETGQLRAHFAGGWTSMFSKDGQSLLERMPEIDVVTSDQSTPRRSVYTRTRIEHLGCARLAWDLRCGGVGS